MAETKTFLLVEDDPHDVWLVGSEFKQAGIPINLQVAQDGVEAMHYMTGEEKYADRAMFPLPAMIMLDIKMPRMNGFEFLKWLRSQSPNRHRSIPVVMMSESNLPEDVEEAYALGANSYMVKPVDWDDFRERIKTLGFYWAAQVETPKIQETGEESWKRFEGG